MEAIRENVDSTTCAMFALMMAEKTGRTQSLPDFERFAQGDSAQHTRGGSTENNCQARESDMYMSTMGMYSERGSWSRRSVITGANDGANDEENDGCQGPRLLRFYCPKQCDVVVNFYLRLRMCLPSPYESFLVDPYDILEQVEWDIGGHVIERFDGSALKLRAAWDPSVRAVVTSVPSSPSDTLLQPRDHEVVDIVFPLNACMSSGPGNYLSLVSLRFHEVRWHVKIRYPWNHAICSDTNTNEQQGSEYASPCPLPCAYLDQQVYYVDNSLRRSIAYNAHNLKILRKFSSHATAHAMAHAMAHATAHATSRVTTLSTTPVCAGGSIDPAENTNQAKKDRWVYLPLPSASEVYTDPFDPSKKCDGEENDATPLVCLKDVCLLVRAEHNEEGVANSREMASNPVLEVRILGKPPARDSSGSKNLNIEREKGRCWHSSNGTYAHRVYPQSLYGIDHEKCLTVVPCRRNFTDKGYRMEWLYTVPFDAVPTHPIDHGSCLCVPSTSNAPAVVAVRLTDTAPNEFEVFMTARCSSTALVQSGMLVSMDIN